VSYPSRPTGYDVAYHVSRGRSDCHLTVGFDRQQGHVPRFLVTLHYRVSIDPVVWGAIARMDHNETSTQGHDVYQDGLHVDIARRSGSAVHLQIRHPPLPSDRGRLIAGCIRFLQQEAQYAVDIYEGTRSPGRPPRFSPDGGDRPPTLIPMDSLRGSMSHESPVEDALTLEELDAALAEATDSTPEEIRAGAKDLAEDMEPLTEADVVGYGEHDGEYGFLPEPGDES